MESRRLERSMNLVPRWQKVRMGVLVPWWHKAYLGALCHGGRK